MLNLALTLFLCALVAAPIALGAAHIWTKMVVEATIFLSLALVLVDSLRGRWSLYKAPAMVPFCCFVGWIGLQLVPLPSALLALLSPASHAAHAIAHPPDASFWAPLSIKPLFTLQELFRFASFAAFYYLSVQLLADRRRLKTALSVCLVAAGAIAFIGIIQSFAGNGRIYWLFDPGPDAFFGPFFYRNHFAGYMAMLLPVCLALFLLERPLGGDQEPLRLRVVRLIDGLRHSAAFRYGLIALLLLASILLSQSRTGISVAVLTSGGMLLAGRKLFRLNRSSPALIALLAILAMVFVGRTGIDQLDTRFGQTVDEDGLSETGKTITGRTGPWNDALGIVRDFPLTGSGMGTFFAIFPSYGTDPDLAPQRQAHNEYLETATDGGLVAVALVAAFLALVFRQNLHLYRQRRDAFARHVAMGAFTGVLALLLHSITDYQFHQTAAVPLTFFFLLGVLTTAIHGRRSTEGDPSLLRRKTYSRPWQVASLAICLIGLTGSLGFHLGEGMALNSFDAPIEATSDLINLSPDAGEEALLAQHRQAMTAAGYDPLNPVYHGAVAYTAQMLGSGDQAEASYRAALRRSPTDANVLQLYGLFLSEREGGEPAKRLIQASVQRERASRERIQFAVLWLLGQGDVANGVLAARDMLDRYPELAVTFLTVLRQSPLPPEIIPEMLPERVGPRLAWATLVEQQGDAAGAAEAYDLALSYMDREAHPRQKYFEQPYNFYRKQKNDERAMAVLQQAVQRLPNVFGFRLQLGDHYARQGMLRKAVEEYRFALQLKPGDKQVRERLETHAAALGQ